VILAAGAIQSPQLLELSGIGNPTILSAHGIPVRHAAPGVGENLQDHVIVRMSWRLSQHASHSMTINERARGWPLAKEVVRYALTRRGLLTFAAGVVCGYVRSRPDVAVPDIQYTIAHASFANPVRRVLDRYPALTFGPSPMRPASRGTVHIQSADPLAPPAIRPNFLHAEADQTCLVAGMRIARGIVAAPALSRLIANEERPGAHAASDDELLDFARRTAATIHHPVGTAKMGRLDDPLVVVDARLRVHGIAALRVVDASIMPTIPTGNTNAPVIMVAERAAEMIAADARAR